MKFATPLLHFGAAVTLVGCAYFNTLYNANRLAAAAERAEREGRPDEARSLWTQAATKAESVAVRFPESKHRDDALLLHGRALSAIRQCTRAVPPLRVAADSSLDPDVRSRARLLLGQCWVQLGTTDSAIHILTPEVIGPDLGRQTEARRIRGRAYLLRGDYERSVRDLAGIESLSSQLDLAVAHIGLGETARATALLERRLADPYDETAWGRVLDSLGRRDVEAASNLVDRLVANSRITTGQRARLLLADGHRWLAAEQRTVALRRFHEAAGVAPDSLDGRVAGGRAAVVVTRRTENLARLPELADALTKAERGGGAGGEIMLFAGVLRRVVALVAPEERRPPDADARLFLLAEAVRDSLEATRLAARLFTYIREGWPASALAPKALLAAAALDDTVADSLVDIVFREYPASPYARVLRGEAFAEYVAVEDSLRLLVMGDVLPSQAEQPDSRRRLVEEHLPKDEVIRHGRRPGKP